MDHAGVTTEPKVEIRVTPLEDSGSSFAQDVKRGLSSRPKRLPPKHFYDAEGSQLFEQICELPEYYLTRTERAILDQNAEEIAAAVDGEPVLVELGSGSSTKTRLLIEALLDRHGELHYVPVDLSETILEESAHALVEDYPELRVTAHVAEYFAALRALAEEEWHRKLILFLGSNIGNFEKTEARLFLQSVRETMSDSDRMLVGIDLIKDRQVLQAAYDDSQGVTARFNLNMLARINRELGGHFDLAHFAHRALFNETESRMEMYLESLRPQNVAIDDIDTVVEFEQGEKVHTENSHKFSVEQIRVLVRSADLAVERAWYDDQRWFSVNLLKPV